MACTHKDSCAMFPVISLSSALKIWQTFYCESRFDTCERYQRSNKGQSVPPNLLPNGKGLDLEPGTAGAISTSAKPVAAASAPGAKPAARAPIATAPAAAPAPANGATYSYYLRVRIRDNPGLSEKIESEIRGMGINLDATVLKPVDGEGTRCLMMLTGQGSEVDLFRAILRIEEIDGVASKVKSVALEKLDANTVI